MDILLFVLAVAIIVPGSTASFQCGGNLQCVSVHNCSNFNPDFAYSCGQFGLELFVCCEPSQEQSLTTTVKTSLQKPNWVTNPKMVARRSLVPDECGPIYTGDKITNGVNASLGQFPWMTLIGYRPKYAQQFIVHLCGGTVINNKYILTAAHCFHVENHDLDSVRLGEFNQDTEIDCELYGGENVCGDPVVDISIDRTIEHDGFNSRNWRNDIGLIRLRGTITFTDYIKPICLPFDSQLNETFVLSRKYTISGWGYTGRVRASDIPSSILQYAMVDALNNTFCNTMLTDQVRPIPDTQICARGQNQEDSCRGDSGGPLTYTGRLKTYQLGIISYGPEGCGNKEIPGVYTRVDKYLEWILLKLEP